MITKDCDHKFKLLCTINGGVHGNVDVSLCEKCGETQEIKVPFTGANGRYTRVAKGTGAFGTDWIVTKLTKEIM